MNQFPEFVKWQSIQRLSSEICYITEKIDGTNGVIYVDPDGTVLAGSRERWLSGLDGAPCAKKDDNFGFSQRVWDRRERLALLGTGFHYGEFHGSGIQRRYGLDRKRWASFAFYRTDLDGIDPDVTVVPILYQGEPTVQILDQVTEQLRTTGSVLYPGFMKPEGVVMSFRNMRESRFKRMCENDRLAKWQQHPIGGAAT